MAFGQKLHIEIRPTGLATAEQVVAGCMKAVARVLMQSLAGASYMSGAGETKERGEVGARIESSPPGTRAPASRLSPAEPILCEEDVDPDPIRQFQRWYEEALRTEQGEPSAMALATATPQAVPSVRMVLLRGFDNRGFQFFTNYDSRKARELEANPSGALVFFWSGPHRQVRIEGRLERATSLESDLYFKGRPAGARLGAWASPQSEVIPSRQWLDDRVYELADRYPDGEIPRPPNWGGYRLVPETIEFWQGQPDRLHDRLRYRRLREGGWIIERLAP
jgi:pyridoxamine 5'-phosphate oxidase